MSEANLDEANIKKLLADPAALAAMPFLQGYARHYNKVAKSGCKPCSAGNRRKTADFQTIRRLIAETSGDNQAKVKEVLGAAAVRIHYKAGGTEREKTI